LNTGYQVLDLAGHGSLISDILCVSI